MKILRTAALIAGAVALAATGVGAAIGAGLLGAGLSTVAAGALATTIGTYAGLAALGLTLIGSLAQKKPTQTGSPTSFDASADGGIPYAMGTTANAGKIVYWKEHGSPGKNPNDRETFVVINSGAGPIEGYVAFYSDQSIVTFDSIGAAQGYYADYMWQKTQLGLTPSPQLIVASGNGSPPPGWTAQHKLSGYAAAMWTLRFDAKKGKYYQNGTPKPLWKIKGVKVYDPRLDSTYPGGSGACRALDEGTYVWSANPYLHGLTWCLGRWQNGKRVLGLGTPIEGIDVAAFVEGANIADANGWVIAGTAYSTDEKWGTLVNILQAGGGEPLALGARISCFVNAPKVSLEVIEVGALSGGAKASLTQPRRDRINTITPRLRTEANFWESAAASPVAVADYVALDGGRRSKEVTYTFVEVVDQAAQLARYDIENAREFGPISLPLRPAHMGYKPGDCLTVNLPEIGLYNRKVLLTQREIDPGTGCPIMTARSETDGKHGYALGQTTTPPPTPSVAQRPLVDAPVEGSWTLAGAALTASGASIPALVIDGATDDPNADAVIFEYRLHVEGQDEETGWITGGTEVPTTTRKEITSVTPSTAYDAAVSYRARGVQGDRLILGPVTAGQFTTSDGTSLLIANSFTIPASVVTASDAGDGTATITIAAHVRRYADRDVNIAGGTITGRVLGRYYAIGYSDITRANGAPTFTASTNYPDEIVSATRPYQHYVGDITTPASGGGSTGGGGTRPPGGGGGGGNGGGVIP